MPDIRENNYSQHEKLIVKNELEKIAKKFGSRGKIAKQLGIRTASVQMWFALDRTVPILRVLQLRQLMGKKIDCAKLRPDHKKLFKEIGLSP